MPTIESTPEFVQSVYDTTRERLEIIKNRLGLDKIKLVPGAL